jgi:hypothetical protein
MQRKIPDGKKSKKPDIPDGHSGHFDGIFRNLFSVQFSRKTFRKTSTMCRKCRKVKGEHLGIISRQTNRQVIAATGLAGAGGGAPAGR